MFISHSHLIHVAGYCLGVSGFSNLCQWTLDCLLREAFPLTGPVKLRGSVLQRSVLSRRQVLRLLSFSEVWQSHPLQDIQTSSVTTVAYHTEASGTTVVGCHLPVSTCGSVWHDETWLSSEILPPRPSLESDTTWVECECEWKRCEPLLMKL